MPAPRLSCDGRSPSPFAGWCSTTLRDDASDMRRFGRRDNDELSRAGCPIERAVQFLSTASARSAGHRRQHFPTSHADKEEQAPSGSAHRQHLLVDSREVVGGLQAHERVDLKRQPVSSRRTRGLERPLESTGILRIASCRSALEPSRLSEMASTPALRSRSIAPAVSSGVALGGDAESKFTGRRGSARRASQRFSASPPVQHRRAAGGRQTP